MEVILSIMAASPVWPEPQHRQQLPQRLVHDHFLPHLRQHFPHGLEVKARAGDLGRLQVFAKHRAEAATSPSASLTRLKR